MLFSSPLLAPLLGCLTSVSALRDRQAKQRKAANRETWVSSQRGVWFVRAVDTETGCEFVSLEGYNHGAARQIADSVGGWMCR